MTTSQIFRLSCILATGMPLHEAQSATLQIVVDNDYALFVGTVAGGPTRLIYQNDVQWSGQASASASFNFDLLRGEDTFYLVALGGGGAEENVSGKINGYNIVRPGVRVSPSVAGSIFASTPVNSSGIRTTVENGSFTVSLSEARSLVSGVNPANWTTPSPTTVSGSLPTVIAANPHSGGIGYTFASNQAVIYRFSTSSVGMAPVPEVSSALGIGGLLGAALFARKRPSR